MNLFITEENLKVLIGRLKKTCDEFIAPKRELLDDIIFGDTKDSNDQLLEYDGNSVVSPRAFLLPQTEPLFEIKSAMNSRFAPILEEKKRIFYGVRPCDIKAIGLTKRFFLDEPVDIIYQRKLENSIFIALACVKPCSQECFCYEIGAGPKAEEGFDLQISPVNRGHLVEVSSKKGRAIISKHKKLFRGATPAQEKGAKAILKDFSKNRKRIDYKRVARIMQEGKVKESLWADIGLRCVICSGCITLCPTCSCFGIADRLELDKGMRIRYCDGCPYAGFTRMAGGNIPQPEHKDHIRRFFEHKLNVDVQRYGRPSCVGCGRCIETCPGNINIRRFIEEAIKV